MTHMQLNRRRIVWRIGNREAAALAVLQQNINVLPGMELEDFRRGQTQGQNRDIGRRLLQHFNSARQGFYRNIRSTAHILYFNHHIRLRHCAAQQRKSGLTVGRRQCCLAGLAMVHGARRDLGTTSATATCTATIGHQQIVAQRSLKYCLMAIGPKRGINRIKRYLMRHVESCKKLKPAKPYNGEMQKDMQLPPRALPRRFRQPRLLLAGCGDVAARIAAQVGTRYRLLALLRHEPDSVAWQTWRSLGATPIAADLDQPRSLKRLRGLATHVIYLAPPADSKPTEFYTDARLNGFLAALQSGGSLPRRLVYIGTSGVYGDCQGALVRESRPCQPKTARGQRRAAAEATLRRWARTRIGAARTTDLANPARKTANAGSILRVPGIYAGDRLPVERLRAGTPALRTEEDTWTNHIHADDLARISWLSLSRSRSLRAYNASDSSTLKMGDWFDAVADAYGLPKPERLARNDLKERVSPMLYSFMSESRRLDNQRLRKELRIQLRYPTVHDFLATLKVPPC